jgi:NodT family efflux transporter outer membrane factor (OMF) lipoprotein
MPKFPVHTLALAAALLAGPAMAQPPSMPAFAPGESTSAASTQSGWWDALGDATLSSLIQRGLDANHDIAQAQARWQHSRALLEGSRAAFGPSGSAGLQGRAAHASEVELPGATRSQRRGDTVQAGLDFSWEVDLFGRLQSKSDAATQRLQGSAAQLQAVRLAISAEIAHAWFALVGAREQLQLARAVVENRERTLQLVEVRARGGLSAPIDDARARADLEAARADIPAQEAEVRIATHRLAVLQGLSPTGYEAPASTATSYRFTPVAVPDAATWLAQRPDLQAHEAELRARALDVAAIRAEFYPRLTFSGVLGFVAGSVGAIGSGGSLSWLSAPSLLAPLFDRPRIQARLDGARADQQQALAAYRQRILVATEEVENAVVRYAAGEQQFDARRKRAAHAATAERLARVRYEAGAADLLELLEAQRTAQLAQALLAQSLMLQRQHLVAVIKGLGGAA